ncbi:3-oxo-tetronate kinase [Agrococcus jejuensis]|uniref:3-oxo-tetronate kinase n=1 Tax=Agrococcus jejuensis TaxID=399736 RepID=UPI0011A8BF3F|nr:3-oxo-tetronate kinase [Agrococcus jejuensis]
MHIGAVADDFTGATDLATTLQARGLRAAVVVEDRPVDAAELAGVDAVVVALKSRTAPVDQAVADSTAALDRLLGWGAERVYVKYCSTFDSTDRGNIGPVLDAVRDRLGVDRTVVVPSFPANGRTVSDGVLRVHGTLLEDSPMRHHPLTPMTRSRIRDLLQPQTPTRVGEIGLDVVRQGAAMLRDAIDAADPGYLVVDAVTDDDVRTIAAATGHLRMLSGGAALGAGIDATGAHGVTPLPAYAGGRLVVAGSASEATRGQVAAAAAAGHAMQQVDVDAALTDADAEADRIAAWMRALPAAALPVVYSVGELADVRPDPTGASAAAVEHVLAGLVARVVRSGDVDRIVVAGGETSGAVVQALEAGLLRIGPQLAPGVCWSGVTTPDGREVAVVLKSGNFGGPDLFSTAWEALA